LEVGYTPLRCYYPLVVGYVVGYADLLLLLRLRCYLLRCLPHVCCCCLRYVGFGCWLIVRWLFCWVTLRCCCWLRCYVYVCCCCYVGYVVVLLFTHTFYLVTLLLFIWLLYGLVCVVTFGSRLHTVHTFAGWVDLRLRTLVGLHGLHTRLFWVTFTFGLVGLHVAHTFGLVGYTRFVHTHGFTHLVGYTRWLLVTHTFTFTRLVGLHTRLRLVGSFGCFVWVGWLGWVAVAHTHGYVYGFTHVCLLHTPVTFTLGWLLRTHTHFTHVGLVVAFTPLVGYVWLRYGYVTFGSHTHTHTHVYVYTHTLHTFGLHTRFTVTTLVYTHVLVRTHTHTFTFTRFTRLFTRFTVTFYTPHVYTRGLFTVGLVRLRCWLHVGCLVGFVTHTVLVCWLVARLRLVWLLVVGYTFTFGYVVGFTHVHGFTVGCLRLRTFWVHIATGYHAHTFYALRYVTLLRRVAHLRVYTRLRTHAHCTAHTLRYTHTARTHGCYGSRLRTLVTPRFAVTLRPHARFTFTHTLRFTVTRVTFTFTAYTLPVVATHAHVGCVRLHARCAWFTLLVAHAL